MHRRQTVPRQWLIVRGETEVGLVPPIPSQLGVLLLGKIAPKQLRRLRQRGATIVFDGPRTARRVHNLCELRRALLARTPVILLSPIFPTGTHPEWQPIPRMRAAALARLARGRLLALGGMDARKFARIERLGFQGWAGISAFRT